MLKPALPMWNPGQGIPRYPDPAFIQGYTPSGASSRRGSQANSHAISARVSASSFQIRPAAVIGEVIVQDWQAAGLLKPLAIKPVVITIEKPLPETSRTPQVTPRSTP